MDTGRRGGSVPVPCGLPRRGVGCENRAVRTEDEGRLLAELASGSRPALAALYDRHAAAMLGLAQRVLGDRRDAEDLVHDVFLEAWHRAHRYDPARGPVRGWLLVMVRSRALDRLRSFELARRHARQCEQEALVADAGVADFDGARDVTRSRALEAISTLPDSQRRIVQMSSLEGLSASEIARRCGLPLGTVKSRLARGLAALRQRLGGHEEALG